MFNSLKVGRKLQNGLFLLISDVRLFDNRLDECNQRLMLFVLECGTTNLASQTGNAVDGICIGKITACNDEFQKYVLLVIVIGFAYQPQFRMEVRFIILLVKYLKDIAFH